jgi:sporulation protein YlmC with PRC-barrel domain
MITKYFAVGAIAIALMAGTALAQTATSPTKAQANSASVNQAYKGQWRVNRMIGLDVYNQDNQKLGDISEILIDQTGKAQTVILGVGGFLGVGEHMVSLNFDKLKFVDERVESKTASAMSTTAPAKDAQGSATSTTGLAALAHPARSANEQWYPDHAVVNLTVDQLKAMPQFKYN